MEISQLYSEIIREHNLDKSKRRKLEDVTHSMLGHNPSCGDEIKLHLKLEGDIIKDASYEGIGCAISQASTSIMIDLIKGKSLKDAKDTVGLFLDMIKSEEVEDEKLESLNEAIVFKNIKNLPARVKCAVLAWRTLEKILKETE